MLSLSIELNKNKIQLVNIYGPNKPQERPQFFENISHYINPQCNTLLGGDFNMVLNEHLDRAGGTPSPTHLSGSQQLSEIVEKQKSMRYLEGINKTKKDFTWQNPNKTIQSRRDRFYIPTNFKKRHKTMQYFTYHMERP